MNIEVLYDLKPDKPDESIYAQAKDRWDSIAKPIDGLGDFEDIICRIASIEGKLIPEASKKALVIMCADNGVVCEGVTQTDQSVTAKVASLMTMNKSSVGVMTKKFGIDIIPVDIGINSDIRIKGLIDKKIRRGTGNILREPAMTKDECLGAIQTGIDIVKELSDKGYDILATGEMGIGNTTTSTALFCALTQTDPENITGRGAGLNDEALANKIRVIKDSIAHHRFNRIGLNRSYEMAFEALRYLGGLDIAGLVGVYIGAALTKMPVIIDGYISAVAALCACSIVSETKEYMIASHAGKEKGTGKILKMLDLKPVIDADMALGEGTGAVMMFPLIDMALDLYSNGTRFDDTQIDSYERFEKE